MLSSIRAGETPNLLIMQYDAAWSVQNLLLVPSFFFTVSAIEKRPPLSPNARRAGWIGCNILLRSIAPDGKIRIVAGAKECERARVRQEYQRVKPLARLQLKTRGWTLDVLTAVRSLGHARFSLLDAYSFESSLSHLHRGNRNVRPKIRQQLQVLRDLGLLRFVSRGTYQLVD
jgi:type II restriction enzyme